MKGLGNAADRLTKGTTALVVRMARGSVEWLKAGEKASDFVVRLVFLALPLVLVWCLVAASRAFLWVLAALWIIAAWRAVPQPAKEQAGTDGLDRDDLIELLWELVGDHRGIHLATVAQQLTKETPGRSWAVADVKKALKAADIPTQHSVRVPGLGVTVGVRRQDLPSSPSPAPSGRPSGGVERQVIPATATATRLTVEDIGGGGGRVIRHPDQTRHIDVRAGEVKE